MTKPYTLAELLQMKPGTLLLGLAKTSEGQLGVAPEWSLSPQLATRKAVKITPYLELRVRWRQHLKRFKKDFGECCYYTPPATVIENHSNRIIIADLIINHPIGIYLGHVVRFGGAPVVNFLTSTGYDVWL
jgi:hypothetical protein